MTVHDFIRVETPLILNPAVFPGETITLAKTETHLYNWCIFVAPLECFACLIKHSQGVVNIIALSLLARDPSAPISQTTPKGERPRTQVSDKLLINKSLRETGGT